MNLTEYPTPRTNELVRTQLARAGMTPTAFASKLTFRCEELEREAAALLAICARYRNSGAVEDPAKIADELNACDEAFDALKSQMTQP